MNIRLSHAIAAALSALSLSATAQTLDPALPLTPEISRLQQLGPRALRENAPPFLRRAVLSDLFRVALEAEVLLGSGQRAQAALRYALVARVSDDPAAAQRASELAASADNLPLAREMAQRWAELDSTSTRAKEVSAALALAEGDVTRAIDSMLASLPSEPQARGKAVVDLARALVRGNERTQALSVMRSLSARENSAPAFFGLAIAEYAAGLPTRQRPGKADTSGAMSATARALALDPAYGPAAAMRAEVMARESASDARAYAQDYLRRNSEAHEVRLFLAQSLADANQHQKAREEFLLVVAGTKEPLVKTESTFAAAVLALRLKNPAQALAELDTLLNDPGANPNILRLYRGQALDALKRRPEAIVLWREIPRGESVWRETQWRIAAAMAADKQYSQARAFLEVQFDNDPDADIPVGIVQAHAGWFRETSAWREALAVLDDGLKRFPDQPDLLYDSAMMADKLARYDDMEARLRRLIALKPDHAQAHNALAYSYAERNVNIAEARRLIDRAITLAPEDAAIMDSVGWVYYREGKFAQAETWLRKALAKMSDGEVVAHLAEVLIAMNRRDEARSALEAFPRDGSNADLVRSAQEKLFGK